MVSGVKTSECSLGVSAVACLARCGPACLAILRLVTSLMKSPLLFSRFVVASLRLPNQYWCCEDGVAADFGLSFDHRWIKERSWLDGDVSLAGVSCQSHIHNADSDESADLVGRVVAGARDAGEERDGFDRADHVF